MTVSSQIIEVLNDLCTKFGIVIDWSQENVLPYAKTLLTKFISWDIATSWVWIGIALFMILVGITLVIFDQTNWDTEIVTCAGVLLIIVFLVVLGTQIFDIVACKVFPEKVIYDYVSYWLSERSGL
jgi:hypothetical protein